MNYANGILVGVFTISIWFNVSVASEDETTNELNKHCQRREDCPDFGYWCNGNMTCQCAGLYIPNSMKTKCVGGVGQKCLYDDDCIQKAFCEKQTMCKCKKNHHPADDGFVCARNSSASTWLLDKQNLIKIIATLVIFMKIS